MAPKAEQRRGFFFYAHFQKYTTNLFQIKEENLWLSSIRLSRFFRRSLSPSAGLAVWGVVNLMEGYGNDNPGAKSQGIKQLMAN